MPLEPQIKALMREQTKLANSSSVMEQWVSNLKQFEQILLLSEDRFKKEFLNHPVIMQSMLMHSPGSLFEHELSIVNKFLPSDFLEKSLPEPDVGGAPRINSFTDKNPATVVHNTVHHNYHIARYSRTLGYERFASSKSFVEWGGGYGNFARIVKTALPKTTYTIIDLPVILAIQWQYLTAVFGKDSVAVITDPSSESIQEGKINLVSSTVWTDVNILADMFVGTWSLSESPISVQNQIMVEKQWFGSTKRLLAFHQCGSHIPFMEESTHLMSEIKNDRQSVIEDIVIIPGKNFYAFR